MLKEDLILEEVRDLRKETKEQSVVLARLETKVDLQYEDVNRRLGDLEDFKEDTGLHDLLELQKKNEKITDKVSEWRTWGYRILFSLPISLITGIIVVVITKGCGK